MSDGTVDAPAGDAVVGAPPPTVDPGLAWTRLAGWTHRIDGDEVVLCDADRRLITVGGEATPVFAVLDTPATLDEVVQRVGRQWPDRPVDRNGAADAVALLADAGVIEGVVTDVLQVWGVTEDGGVLEIVIAAHLSEELARRWPPRGLEQRREAPDKGGAALGRLGLGRTGLFVPDGETAPAAEPDENAWGLLEQTLTAVAAEHLTHLVAVHSAVVEWGGSVLLVPATSGAGKSTLTMAAHRAGARILSDEYALIDPHTGLVAGWRRPVRVRRADGSGEDRVEVAVDSDALPVGLVASITFDPDGPVEGWTQMSGSEVVLELLSHTICAQTRPDAALDAALAVSKAARGVKGSRGEADEAVAALLAQLASGGPTPS